MDCARQTVAKQKQKEAVPRVQQKEVQVQWRNQFICKQRRMWIQAA